MSRVLLAALLLAFQQLVLSEAQQGRVEGGKQIPPPGVPIPAADRAELEAGVKHLGAEIDALKSKHADLLPDVQIYHKAVDWALRYDEFFNVKEVGAAKELLKTGLDRAKQLAEGKPAWTTATGLIPRG